MGLPNGQERFALALMLCTPSELNRMWLKEGSVTDGKLSAALQNEIDKLELSPIVKQQMIDFLADNAALRSHFATTAKIFAGAYEGDPCPIDPSPRSIVAALRRLDEEEEEE